jgi:hypothetical protein
MCDRDAECFRRVLQSRRNREMRLYRIAALADQADRHPSLHRCCFPIRPLVAVGRVLWTGASVNVDQSAAKVALAARISAELT